MSRVWAALLLVAFLAAAFMSVLPASAAVTQSSGEKPPVRATPRSAGRP